jgi:hypothetical protein
LIAGRAAGPKCDDLPLEVMLDKSRRRSREVAGNQKILRSEHRRMHAVIDEDGQRPAGRRLELHHGDRLVRRSIRFGPEPVASIRKPRAPVDVYVGPARAHTETRRLETGLCGLHRFDNLLVYLVRVCPRRGIRGAPARGVIHDPTERRTAVRMRPRKQDTLHRHTRGLREVDGALLPHAVGNSGKITCDNRALGGAVVDHDCPDVKRIVDTGVAGHPPAISAHSQRPFLRRRDLDLRHTRAEDRPGGLRRTAHARHHDED